MDEQTQAHPAPFECSSTLGKLGTALAKAQGEFPEAKKSGVGKVGAQGSQRSYPYATLSDVIEAVRAPLAKNGLSVIQPPFTEQDGAASVRTVLLHESGEWLAGVVTVPTASHGAAAHALGSSIAYCRRYGLTSLLGIATEDDDGATANEAGPRQQQQRPTAPAPATNGTAPPPAAASAPSPATLAATKCKDLYLALCKLTGADPKVASKRLETWDALLGRGWPTEPTLEDWEVLAMVLQGEIDRINAEDPFAETAPQQQTALGIL